MLRFPHEDVVRFEQSGVPDHHGLVQIKAFTGRFNLLSIWSACVCVRHDSCTGVPSEKCTVHVSFPVCLLHFPRSLHASLSLSLSLSLSVFLSFCAGCLSVCQKENSSPSTLVKARIFRRPGGTAGNLNIATHKSPFVRIRVTLTDTSQDSKALPPPHGNSTAFSCSRIYTFDIKLQRYGACLACQASLPGQEKKSMRRSVMRGQTTAKQFNSYEKG